MRLLDLHLLVNERLRQLEKGYIWSNRVNSYLYTTNKEQINKQRSEYIETIKSRRIMM